MISFIASFLPNSEPCEAKVKKAAEVKAKKKADLLNKEVSSAYSTIKSTASQFCEGM